MSYRLCLAMMATTVGLAAGCIALPARPEPKAADEGAARLNAAFSKFKAGLWQIDITIEDSKNLEMSGRTAVIRMCADKTGAASSPIPRRKPNPNNRCKFFETPTASGGMLLNLECVDEGGVWGSSSLVTGLSEDGETLTETMHGEDGTGVSSKEVMRWLGACPADMKPGQVDIKNPYLPPQPAR